MDKQNNTQRRPSGFGSTGQTPRRQPAPPQTRREPIQKEAPAKPQRENHARRKRKPREKKPRNVKKLLLAVLLIAVLAAVAAIIIANSGKTYHYLPTVQLKTAEADFTPESTPLPTTEAP